MRLFRRAEDWERDEWAVLARYNAERSRGLVHTPEWQSRMAEEQVRFDEQQREWREREGVIVIEQSRQSEAK